MERGISPLISSVVLILVAILAIYLGLNFIQPSVEAVYEQAAINEAEQNLRILDAVIREVASEGLGSLRKISIKLSQGNLKVINSSENFTGAIQFKIELKHSPFTAPMLKKIGNLKYSVGMSSVGLVGYWNLNEGNGSVAEDHSSHGNHGILYNGTTACGNPPLLWTGCPKWIEGKFGKALSFDGIDDYVNINHTPDLNPISTISIEAWVRLNERDKVQGIIGKAEDIWSNASYSLRILDNNKISFFTSNTGDNSVYDDLESITSLSPNIGYHVVAVFKKPYKYLYINGIQSGSSNWNYILYNSTSNIIVGGYAYGNGLNYLINGSLDEIKIYNRGLSEEEIEENYKSSSSDFQIVLEYGKTILVGNLNIWKGEKKVCVEKISEINEKPVIEVKAC